MARLNTAYKHSWFEGSVFYQIYPRSFQDSNNDGIGDINGIINRLDYLNDGNGSGLGIDCIWLSPFFTSPMRDFGYDILNYRDVDSIFGKIEDFDLLLVESHKRGIKILIDLVPNHTSEEHPWFKESLRSKNNTKSDWYIWRDPKPNGQPPNNWLSVFGGSAWQYEDSRKQYYLHSFLKEQPDLNWENKEVQDAICEVMSFWLNKGVDGFRIDAIDLMGKDYSFPDEAINNEFRKGQVEYYSQEHKYSRDAGKFFHYLRTMVNVLDEYEDRVIILECYFIERHNPELYFQFYREINKPNCLPFNFELIFIDWNADEIQQSIDDFQKKLRNTDLPVYVLGNHDNQRFINKVGYDAARSGALLLFSLPGISQVYYGEELGMEDINIPALRQLDKVGRDKSRTPMQWSSKKYAGFSQIKPWLPISNNFNEVNVEKELSNKKSMLNLYKALINIRKSNNSLRYGTYIAGKEYDDIISFKRKYKNETLIVYINVSSKPSKFINHSDTRLIISSNPEREKFDGILEPYEGIILQS